MPVETKYVVVRDGKELGVFASQQEAEAFEALEERADKLAVVLTATVHDHRLDSESIQAVARALAGREKDLAAIFAPPAKGKTKARGTRPRAATKRAPKAAAPAPQVAETAPQVEMPAPHVETPRVETMDTVEAVD
jgi:dsDNA-binding SOS-regulon protein